MMIDVLLPLRMLYLANGKEVIHTNRRIKLNHCTVLLDEPFAQMPINPKAVEPFTE